MAAELLYLISYLLFTHANRAHLSPVFVVVKVFKIMR